MRKLFPSFAPPETWRSSKNIVSLNSLEWQKLRKKILQRDEYACQYCGFKSQKYQIVHHIDGNPQNNSDDNLVVICQMCNLVEHAGQGCVVQGVVDLYEKSIISLSVFSLSLISLVIFIISSCENFDFSYKSTTPCTTHP